MITESHPFYFLLPLFQRKDSIFSLSKYVYVPDSLFDEREYMSISGEDFSIPRIEKELASLRPDQELALHSNVRIKNKTLHIPMIDFSVAELGEGDIFNRMSRYLPKSLMLNMAIYTSGRSFHAYSTTLLGPKDWHDFMGRLLLVNPYHQQDLIDARWIGHRLIGGFGSLRWSNNSRQYLNLPSRVAFP